MLTLAALALRDLRHQRAFSLFFIANLALGLAGALLLDSLQGSVHRTLVSRSRAMLGADVRVSSSRALSGDEIARLDGAARAGAAASISTSDIVELYSMVSSGAHARLAEVRGIDRNFPLHGALVLAHGGVADAGARDALERSDEAWADPSLLDQLGIALGGEIRVGTQTLRITDTLLRDTGLSVRAASLAPRLYMSRARLAESGLIETGSRVDRQHMVALAAGADANAAAGRMRAAVADPRVRIVSHEESVTEISGAYSRVTGYLGIVSLVALALAGVASSYLFRAFLRRRLPDLAILRSLGARHRDAVRLLVFEVGVLAALSAAVALAATAALLPIAAWLLSDILPAELQLGIGLREAGVALLIALAVGPVSCLPMLARLGTLRVADLFQEQAHLTLARRPRDVLLALPALGLLFAVAAMRIGNVRHGAWFSAVFVGALVIATATGAMLLPLAQHAGSRLGLSTRLALRQLSPRRRASRTAFVALAMTALLIGLPPQLRSLMMQQLRPPASETVPSLFLFDIQPEQTEPLHEHLKAAGTDWQRLAPMVRARLIAINGDAIANDVDTANDPSARGSGPSGSAGSRRYNLTYQREMHATEKIVAGRPFGESWDESSGALPQISLEAEFAKRLGFRIGDRLRFDVQGIEVEGEVVNLREVNWTSLQPNFFVSFQTGVLEAAPSVFLASIPALDAGARERLQSSIVAKFPNISMIDVSRGVERALGLLTQLRWAVAATGWTALAVGLVLVLAIARDEADERRWDVNLMKVLGARHELLRTIVTIEFAVLGAIAAMAGCAIGIAACAVLASGVLDVAWHPAWQPVAFVMVVLPAIAAATARIAMRRVLRKKPSLSLG